MPSLQRLRPSNLVRSMSLLRPKGEVRGWARASLLLTGFLRSTNPDHIRAARMGMTVVLTFGLALVAGFAFVNAVSDSPLVPSFRSRANITTMLPEGWAFFTRNPREPQWLAFGRVEDRWMRLEQRHASAVNRFGFGRYAPLQMMELGALIRQSEDTDWVAFPADTDPLQIHAASVPVHNPAARPILCGDILVVEREPVPWAWSPQAASIRLGGRLLHMTVECKSRSRQVRGPRSEHASRTGVAP
jgi:antimicrobial peptide system SdpA family protein